MGNIFQFKQFAVDQENCAMRINTDAVLLGAKLEAQFADTILDIGTGTGVIALMLAQRFPEAEVWAVEIDQLAAETAIRNFEQSPFAERLHGKYSDIFLWKTDLQFDLIVSNPPFYINSLHNPDQRKKIAKHTDDTFFCGLMSFAAEKLNTKGSLQIIVPVELCPFLIEEGLKNNLFLNKNIQIHSFEDSDCFRCILEFGAKQQELTTEKFVIYSDRSIYSSAYRQLLQPFFLAY